MNQALTIKNLLPNFHLNQLSDKSRSVGFEQYIESFEKHGFPNRKTESYKYNTNKQETYIQAIEGKASHSDQTKQTDANSFIETVLNQYPDAISIKISDINSTSNQSGFETHVELSNQKQHSGVQINLIKKPFLDLNNYESPFKEHGVFHLNTLNCDTFIDIKIVENIKAPIILDIAFEKKSFSSCAFNIHIQDFASCDFIHIQRSSTQLQTQNIQVHAKNNSKCHYTLINNLSDHCLMDEHIDIHQDEQAKFELNSIHLNGKNTRSDVSVQLKSNQAHFDLHALNMNLNTEENRSLYCTVNHLAKNTTSKQLIRNVIAEKCESTCISKVYVAKNCPQVDSSQLNNNLLLADKAKVNSCPQLEVYSDDVLCAHGSSSGQLDDEAMFYLQSRGIDQAQAKKALLEAFACEVVDHISTPKLSQLINNQMLKKIL